MKKEMVTCKDCGKTWEKRSDSIKTWRGRCRSCSQKIRIIKPESRKLVSDAIKKKWENEEYRQHMSNAHKGLTGEKSPSWKGGKPKCVDCGKTVSDYGRIRCRKCYTASLVGVPRKESTRIKMSEAQRGEKSHRWQGGISRKRDVITHSIEYTMWRKSVFEIDNYTCQECGKRGTGLHAHHIKAVSEFPELVYDISNGMTLCVACHKETDSYGFKQYFKMYHSKNT